MYVKPITYENLDGETVTKEFHFNIWEPELVDLEVEHKEGFKEMIEQIIATEDRKALVELFKKFIKMTYGVRDGDAFIKNDELTNTFTQTPAYAALYRELVTDDKAAAEFLTGVLPRDMRGDVAKAMEEAQKTGQLPTPPTPPTPPKPPTPPTTQPSGV